jgi:hypothetical protein
MSKTIVFYKGVSFLPTAEWSYVDDESALVPKFGVNFTLILQIWPKIEHSSTSCLQQLMDFGKRSLIPPAVLAYEPDGGFSLPSLGSRVS